MIATYYSYIYPFVSCFFAKNNKNSKRIRKGWGKNLAAICPFIKMDNFPTFKKRTIISQKVREHICSKTLESEHNRSSDNDGGADKKGKAMLLLCAKLGNK